MDKNFEKSVYHFITLLKHFEYRIEAFDRIWDVIFPHERVRQTIYHYIRVTKYQKTFYIHHYDGELPTLREMYQQYADGRHEGLLDIDGNSQEEFADWIDEKNPKRNRGGHPWEIKRGGNTTHIDLFVRRPDYYEKKGFIVGLRGASSIRLKETICMFLGIRAAGLPITIDDPEGIRKRLLGQDNIGIVPCFHSLHRANQDFYEHESIYDVMHYDDLGRYKKRIQPFVTWEPLPILKSV